MSIAMAENREMELDADYFLDL